jgi:hypothetical protein
MLKGGWIMSKIPLVMDLVAGLLLACDLLPKTGILSRFHDCIKKFIKEIDTNNFTNNKTMIFSGSLSIFIFIMLLLWVYYKNSEKINYNIWIEVGWFSLGILMAWCIITLIAKLLKKIGVLGIFWVGLFLSILTLTVVFPLRPSTELSVSAASFIYICFLYPLAMVIAGKTQEVLLADEKKPFFIFAVVGLTIFVASKLIELTA